MFHDDEDEFEIEFVEDEGESTDDSGRLMEDARCSCNNAGLESNWHWSPNQGCYVCTTCGDSMGDVDDIGGTL